MYILIFCARESQPFLGEHTREDLKTSGKVGT